MLPLEQILLKVNPNSVVKKPLANSPLGTQPPPLQMDVAQQPDSSSKEKLFLFFEEPFFSKPKSYLVVGKVVGDAKKRILTSTSKRELKTVQGLPISPEAKDISIELELLAKPEGGDDEKEGELHGTESVMVLSEKLAEMMKDPGKKVLMGTVKFKSSHGVSILNLSASYGKQAEAAASALAIPKKLISLRIDAISKKAKAASPKQGGGVSITAMPSGSRVAARLARSKSEAEESSIMYATADDADEDTLWIPLSDGDKSLSIRLPEEDLALDVGITKCVAQRQSYLMIKSEEERGATVCLSLCGEISKNAAAEIVRRTGAFSYTLRVKAVRRSNAEAQMSTVQLVGFLLKTDEEFRDYDEAMLSNPTMDEVSFPARTVRADASSIGTTLILKVLDVDISDAGLPPSTKVSRPVETIGEGDDAEAAGSSSSPSSNRSCSMQFIADPQKSASGDSKGGGSPTHWRVAVEVFARHCRPGSDSISFSFLGYAIIDTATKTHKKAIAIKGGGKKIGELILAGEEESNEAKHEKRNDTKENKASTPQKDSLSSPTREQMEAIAEISYQLSENHEAIVDKYGGISQRSSHRPSSGDSKGDSAELKKQIEDLERQLDETKAQLDESKAQTKKKVGALEICGVEILKLRKQVEDLKAINERISTSVKPIDKDEEAKIREILNTGGPPEVQQLARRLLKNGARLQKRCQQLEGKAAEFVKQLKKARVKINSHKKLEDAHQQQTAYIQTLQAKMASYKKKLKHFDVEKYSKTIRNQEKIINKLEDMLAKAYDADKTKEQGNYLKAIEKLTEENAKLRTSNIDLKTKVALMASKLPEDTVEALLKDAREEALNLKIERMKNKSAMILDDDGVKVMIDDSEVQKLTKQLAKQEKIDKELRKKLQDAEALLKDKILEKQGFVGNMEARNKALQEEVQSLRNRVANADVQMPLGRGGEAKGQQGAGGPASMDPEMNIWRFKYAQLEQRYKACQQQLQDVTKSSAKQVSKLKIQLQQAKIAAQTGMQQFL